ncbi:cytochrome c [Desulfuromonas sp. TF]|uniref:c-type cytochrome n=1 Tax=Desulfuromonas sp. TF TaxID=1232410 RepID=UPI000408A57C|nr:cytochrome c [Desulfuromonas sp. TF]
MKRTPLLLSLLLLLTACGESISYPERTPPEDFLQMQINVEAGRELFREHCVLCHGTLEEGRSLSAEFNSPASTFEAIRYRSVDPAYLFWRIAKGKTVEPYLSRGSIMPAWGPHFTDEQIWQLVAYIRIRP